MAKIATNRSEAAPLRWESHPEVVNSGVVDAAKSTVQFHQIIHMGMIADMERPALEQWCLHS
jgi:hypothetical protein